jgi:hypothetical protein
MTPITSPLASKIVASSYQLSAFCISSAHQHAFWQGSITLSGDESLFQRWLIKLTSTLSKYKLNSKTKPGSLKSTSLKRKTIQVKDRISSVTALGAGHKNRLRRSYSLLRSPVISSPIINSPVTSSPVIK